MLLTYIIFPVYKNGQNQRVWLQKANQQIVLILATRWQLINECMSSLHGLQVEIDSE